MLRDDRGVVAIIFAFALMLLVGCAALAIDIGRGVSAATRIQGVLDAAALAAGRAALFQQSPETAAQAVWDAADKPNGATLEFSQNTSAGTFTATGSISLSTAFARVWGESFRTLSMTRRATATIKPHTGNQTATEIVLVLDASMSLTPPDFAYLRNGAADFVNIVLYPGASGYPVRVGLVPFGDGVKAANAGAFQMFTGHVDGDQQIPSCYNSPPSTNLKTTCMQNPQPLTYAWCVTARADNSDATTTMPANKMKAWNLTAPYHDGATCSPVSYRVLTDNKQTLQNRIAELNGDANASNGHVAMQWAQFLLSPLWPFGAAPWDVSATQTRKIILLASDGHFNQGSGVGTAANIAGAKAVCDILKANGVEVFSILFAGGGANPAPLTHCATDASHFYQGQPSDLGRLFRDIALKITHLRLTN